MREYLFKYRFSYFEAVAMVILGTYVIERPMNTGTLAVGLGALIAMGAVQVAFGRKVNG